MWVNVNTHSHCSYDVYVHAHTYMKICNQIINKVKHFHLAKQFFRLNYLSIGYALKEQEEKINYNRRVT